MSLVDCNDELTDTLGKRMTDEEFNDKYNNTIEELTRESLNDMNNEDATNDEWDEEFVFQKGKFMDENKIILSD